MPGTIQVSVLDFTAPPSSSSTPSQFSIKVSMGKREYQVSDKGDLSFPLTTFRDDLTVTIQDSEGNEISRIGVETRSVVEKGLLDDIFPIEGGGNMHMKLQFILSDEERNRVRLMRESALKRKHEELLNSVVRRSQSAAALSSFSNHVSDSHRRLIPVEVASTKKVANISGLASNMDCSYGNENVAATQSDHRPITTIKKEYVLVEKYDELHTSSTRSSETAVMVDSLNHEISDSQRRFLPVEAAVSNKEETTEAGLVSNPVSFIENETFGTKNIEGTLPNQIQKTPNDTGKSEETSSTDFVSEAVSVHIAELSHRDSVAAEIEAPTAPPDTPARDISLGDASPLLSRTVVPDVKNTTYGKLEPVGAQKSKKQSPPRRTPSNVRKMVSAFEVSRTQEAKPDIKLTHTKSQSKKIVLEAQTRSSHLDEAEAGNKSTDSGSGSMVNSFLDRKLLKPPTYVKEEEKIGSVITLDGAKLSTTDTEWKKELSATYIKIEEQDPSSKNKFEVLHKDFDIKVGKKFPENVTTTSTVETTISRRIPNKQSGNDQPDNFFSKKPDADGDVDIKEIQISDKEELKEVDTQGYSRGNIVVEERQRGDRKELGDVDGQRSCRDDVKEIQKGDAKELQYVDIIGASNNMFNPAAYWEEKHHNFERSCAWIFPDGPKHFCVTTSGIRVIDLMDSCNSARTSREGKKSSSAPENGNKVTKGEKMSDKLNNSELVDSADTESCKGPIANAIKVAIMIGFGTLVLLTRQRKNR